jgi:hypothetical protein
MILSGEPVRVELFAPHQKYFSKSGKELPSVSKIAGIAKQVPGAWHNRQGLAGIDTAVYVQRLADIGTIAHARIESATSHRPFDDSNIDPAVMDASEPAFRRFMDWWRPSPFVALMNEVRMVSKKLRCGGTLDLLAGHTERGGLYLLDIKATNDIKMEHLIQVAGGYAPMFEEVYDKAIEEVLIVRIGREPGDSLNIVGIHGRDRKPYEDAFRARRRLYDADQNLPEML